MTQRQPSSASGTPLCGSFEAHDPKRYYYSTVPITQPPPVAYMKHGKHLQERPRAEAKRVQTSFSSATSATSDLSYKKHSTPSPEENWASPTLEQTLVDGEQRPSAQVGSAGSRKAGHGQRESQMAERTSPAVTYIQERRRISEEIEEEDSDHAVWILFWLSVLDPIHSLASCLFTLVVTFGLLLAFPIRLVHKKSSFGDQIIRAIAPLYKNHLEMLYAPSVDYAFEWDFRPGMLIAIHLVSPLISMGVAVAAWISAAFWVFAFIMGNPDGTERRDDGRDAVLAVRNWWESVFLKALRPRAKPSMRSIV
ncbi:hypothetical protein H2198_008834 [Neophaeococcomyces mojaviensis]|uniref:Uncharacterized protein n=1 Tax=Neophaeococcomyces mojaviensis TaxID=3383035 RepID=A0ACC2ZWJ0_9EURO|nr:hypothetical protein H2198_008834 [Knufia sp. JES_112]